MPLDFEEEESSNYNRLIHNQEEYVSISNYMGELQSIAQRPQNHGAGFKDYQADVCDEIFENHFKSKIEITAAIKKNPSIMFLGFESVRSKLNDKHVISKT